MTNNQHDGQPCHDRCPCAPNCPQQRAWEILGGKWKLPLLCSLAQDGATRYNDLKRKIGGITNTMLSGSLKELERDGLIHREMYPEIPPKVEYSLTERGHSLVRVLDQLCTWGEENRPKDQQKHNPNQRNE